MPVNETFFSLLMQGIELMVIGMGIVYAFLILLVFVITWSSSIIQKYFPDAPVASASRHKPASKVVTHSHPNMHIVSAITAAIHQHRNKHNK